MEYSSVTRQKNPRNSNHLFDVKTILLRIAEYASFYCALLYCTLQVLHFLKFKVCGNSVVSKSITIFPTAFVHFVGHILVILAVFYIIIMFVMVLLISDL